MKFLITSLWPSVLLVALSLGVVDCQKQAPSTQEATATDKGGGPVVGDWVVIHSFIEPFTLNLVTAPDAVAAEIQGYIYESLLITDPVTLKFKPWIAELYPTLSPDRRFYDVYLRKDVTFSDGEGVTSKDFVFYLKAIKNPLIDDATPIRGYYERIDSAYLVDGDPYHLRVVMHEPYYLGEQFVGGLYAFPQHIWDPDDLSDEYSFKELNSGNTTNPAIGEFARFVVEHGNGESKEFLVGSGPYMFTSWNRGSDLTLERNPSYWNRKEPLGRAYPEKLIWRIIPRFDTALIALRTGEIDLMPRIEKEAFVQIESGFSSNGLTAAVYDYPAYTYIGYNGEHPIFRDPAVRRALARAIDRDAIIEKVYFGGARPVQSPIFYKRPEYDTTLPIIRYDLAAATKMLADAGWKDSNHDGVLDKVIGGKLTDLRFSILLNQGNRARQQTAAIVAQALGKIGVVMRLETLQWSTFLKRTHDNEYDAYIGGWVMGITESDPYQMWHSNSIGGEGANHVRFRNATVDSLIESLRGEFDVNKRIEYHRRIQRIINNEQPYNFLVSERYTGAYSNRFRGVEWFPVAPCYNAGWWWVPKELQRYGANGVIKDR